VTIVDVREEVISRGKFPHTNNLSTGKLDCLARREKYFANTARQAAAAGRATE
jgi:hypothetical protein